MHYLMRRVVHPGLFALVVVLAPLCVSAHPGGVDEDGCHVDYKNREHCH